jgi:hypothetical protein
VLRPGWRPVLLVVLLLAAGASGVRNAVHEWPDAIRAGQKLATVSEMAHGIASWITLVGLGARKAWARPAAWVWVGLITLTAGLASAYWGDGPWPAALAGAAATALLCGFAVRLGLQPPLPAPPPGGAA